MLSIIQRHNSSLVSFYMNEYVLILMHWQVDVVDVH